jgi:hypothetical protein
MRASAAAGLCLLAFATAGCGLSSEDDQRTDPNDKRATALECLVEEKEIDARLLGRDAIQVGDPQTGPRIRFFLTGGEAEAQQFLGRGEGAEQIKSALLFTRKGSEATLEATEECLNDL